MLVFAFFTAVFSSVSWLIYAVMFVNTKLMDENLWEQSSQDMLLFLSVVFLFQRFLFPVTFSRMIRNTSTL